MNRKRLRPRTISEQFRPAWEFKVGHKQLGHKQEVSHMSGNLHVGLAALGAAISVGLIGMKASDAVGRNPVASTKILVQSILAIAFAEAIVFYALFLVK
jgi:F-type H+-transporting ATPase subunit c